MQSFTLEFMLAGEIATVTAYFSGDPVKPFASLQLKSGDFVANGVDKVRDCLPNDFDALARHILQEYDAANAPIHNVA